MSHPTLQLRNFRNADLPAIACAMSDERVTQHYGLETDETDAQAIAREQLHWYQQQSADGEGWWQAICMDGQLVGAMGAYDRDDDGDSAELGYWLLPRHWGQGLMRGALQLWLPEAFNHLRLHSMVAYVEQENTASARLLTSLGFCREGLLRECSKRGSRYVSLQRFTLLAHEL